MQNLLEKAEAGLKKAGCETPRLDAEVLLAHALGCERHELYATNDIWCQAPGEAFFRKCLQRRINREPVAYIIGYKEFWSLKIKVTPAVLIPRPETEAIVEKTLQLMAKIYPTPTLPLQRGGIRILDLCAGSGCITAALAKELPNAYITVSDISKEALEVARENLEFVEFVKDRVTFIQSNLFEKIKSKFDLIISNPPYIPTSICETLMPEVWLYEPRQALDGGADGLDFVRKIRKDAPRYLKANGWLILENGPKVEVSQVGFTPAWRKGCGGMGPASSEARWGSDPPE